MDDRNLILQPSTVVSDLGSYRGHVEYHEEPVGKPLPDRLASAHEITRRHNRNDHSQCTAESCPVIARVEREDLARV